MSDLPPSDLLSRLKDQIAVRRDNPHGKFVAITASELAALVECAEIVQTDYLLLSSDQQMRALRVLKEFGV